MSNRHRLANGSSHLANGRDWASPPRYDNKQTDLLTPNDLCEEEVSRNHPFLAYTIGDNRNNF